MGSSSSSTTTAAAKIARELQIVKNKKASQANNKNVCTKLFGYFHRQQQLLFLYINVTLFAGMPMDLPFHKKFDILMNNSKAGMYWELITAIAALFASSCYVAETYSNRNYAAIQFFKNEDAVVSILFTFDYVITLLVTQKRLKFFFSPTGIIDLATFIPYWITLGILTSGGKNVNLGLLRFLRFLRILRLMRFLRLLKTMKDMGGALTIQKQIATIIFTVFAVLFIGAGIFQIMENDVKAIMEYQCQSIGPLTNFLPSCCDGLPFDQCNALSYCDCLEHNCNYQYNYNDPQFQPSAISCETVNYFDSIYFLVVTVATLGYGDFAPSTELSRVCTMFIILFSIVVIPLQVQNLAKIVGMTSTFRQRYVRQKIDETHVIICGHVSNRPKLERFLNEFFHPSRIYSRDRDVRVLLLSPTDPTDAIKDMLVTTSYGKNCVYLIGSALNIEDLKKASAYSSKAIFFFCNTEAHNDVATLDDAANVLRLLSINNFKPQARCFAQIVTTEERDVLRDVNVEVVLCVDEFRSAVMARNAICPGISTLIENLFHTFQDPEESQVDDDDNPERLGIEFWLTDYLRGAGMELYYIPLPKVFIEKFQYMWSLMVESIFLEWSVMLIGVCSAMKNSVILNPSELELQQDDTTANFFGVQYTTGILLCESSDEATSIARAIADVEMVKKIAQKVFQEESTFHVRTGPAERKGSTTVQSIIQRAKKPTELTLEDVIVAESKYSTFTLSRSATVKTSQAIYKQQTQADEESVFLGYELHRCESDDPYDHLQPIRRNSGQYPSDDLRSQGGRSFEGDEKAAELSGENLQMHQTHPRAPISLMDEERPRSPGSPLGSMDSTSADDLLGLVESSLQDDSLISSGSQTPLDSSFEKTSSIASNEKALGKVGRLSLPSLSLPLPSLNEQDNRTNGVSPPLYQTLIQKNAGTGVTQQPKTAAASGSSTMSKRISVVAEGDEDGEEVTNGTLPPLHDSTPSFKPDPTIRTSSGIALSERSDSGSVTSHTALLPTSSTSTRHSMLKRGSRGSERFNQSEKETKGGLQRIPSGINTGFSRPPSSHEGPMFGLRSGEIQSASKLSRHVVVFGNSRNLDSFVSELRRPLITIYQYRPILFVGPEEPAHWEKICRLYDDVYFIRGNLSISVDYNRANIRDASTVVLMADRDNLAQVDDEDLDAVTLFTYLKLTGHIPASVFFTAELTFESNMVVLNRHIMQHRFDRERDVRHNVHNKSFLTVKGRLSGFSEYTIAASIDQPAPLISARERKQSFMQSFRTSMKEGVIKGGMGAFLRPTLSAKENSTCAKDNNSEESSSHGRLSLMDKSQTSTKEKSKSWSQKSQKRGTVAVLDSSAHSVHSSARNSPRQHNPLHGGLSPRTPRSTTNHVETEIGPVVEVHELPVFASGRAFVPVAIDTILANSYFDQFTPLMCERLVCGQDLQTMYQIDIPLTFVHRKFVDLFRAFLSKRIYVLAIYRAPDVEEGSLLPYVCTCPRPDLKMRRNDRLFVYCNPVELDYALNSYLKLPLRIETKGAVTMEYLGENGAQQIVPKLLGQGYNMMI